MPSPPPIFDFFTPVSVHTWNLQDVIHFSFEKGNGVWSNRVYWGADELVAQLVDSLMMHLFFPTVVSI